MDTSKELWAIFKDALSDLEEPELGYFFAFVAGYAGDHLDERDTHRIREKLEEVRGVI